MNTKSLISGGVCVFIGGCFAISAATSLKIGTSTNMGPGYFPFSLAIILMGTGIYIAVKALTESRGDFRFDVNAVPWRGLILVCFAPVFLGLTIRGLGLLPSVFVTSMISGYASRTQTFRLAFFVSALLAVFCALIFSYFLKLPIPVIGPWLNI
ncbi:tripartite tricarboxylate transporter TctB family protein [Phyllobacterium sophorae]|nr:tripartite tricarboxylate transporter TctB family protein [Phyllobacterium sophorae]